MGKTSEFMLLVQWVSAKNVASRYKSSTIFLKSDPEPQP